MNEKGNHTARKRAEEALKASEERFRLLYEQTPIPYQSLDEDGRLIEVNQAWLNALGYSREEVIDRGFGEFLTPPFQEAFRQRFPKFKAEGEIRNLEFEMVRKDGTLLLVSYDGTIGRDPEGRFLQTHCIFRDITALKRVEEEGRLARQEWENIFQSIGHPAVVLDPDLVILAANRAATAATGRSVEALLGKHCYEVFHGSDHPPQDCPFEKMLHSKHLETVDMEMEVLNGTYMISCTPVVGEGGRLEKIIHIATDITASKRAEEALEAERFKLREYFDNLPLCAYNISFDGLIMDCNRVAVETLGYKTKEDLIGKPLLTTLYAPSSQEKARQLLERWKRERKIKNEELQVVTKEGKVLDVLLNVDTIYDRESKPLFSLSTHLDITERKRVEEALAASEEKYRLVVQNASQGIVVLQDGRLKFINAWACEFMAYPESEMFGKPFLSFVHPEDRGLVAERYEKRLKGEPTPPVYSFRLVGRTGRSSWVEVSAARVLWEGQPAALAFLSDITERKRLEEQVLQLQKMEAVGRLAGGVAHDYNNFLQVIMGYGEMLEKGLPTDDPLRKYVAGIQKAADRAASLTQQLLAFSRRQAVMPVVLDLSRAVAEAGKMLRRLIGEDIEMTTELAPDLGRVRADMVQVEQMIMNLALNARDAMPQGGKLTLRTANVVLDEAFTASRLEVSPGPYVLLEVSDTGHGMDESTLAHIFEPFFTTREKSQGTGLGLSMVYGIVKQSGGHIEVESAPGKGATFKVYFPRIEEEEQQRKSAPAETTLPGGTETVLLVEDEPEIQGLIREVLSAQGFSVLEAGNGEEALKLSGELPGPIHLLITDVVMPGMSGRDLAQRLAALRPDMKLLFMSGYTDDAIIRHGLLVEKLAFLQKPFRPEALLRKVRETLDAS